MRQGRGTLGPGRVDLLSGGGIAKAMPRYESRIFPACNPMTDRDPVSVGI